ncbi:4Fe-4S domain-containing protein [Nocardia sp. R6R-6]|uniref:4Fe-4S domain-containing protein n=1 Tax=Nocardia sp. R6R-6 TaxID=3459303 RepID=UPI00403DCF9D
MNVTVDIAVCRGYANCVVESPDVFDIDDANGKVLVVQEHPDESLHAETRAAAQSCPVRAITLSE